MATCVWNQWKADVVFKVRLTTSAPTEQTYRVPCVVADTNTTAEHKSAVKIVQHDSNSYDSLYVGR